MYTTNIIENLNRQYRKVTKGKQIRPIDDIKNFLYTNNAVERNVELVRGFKTKPFVLVFIKKLLNKTSKFSSKISDSKIFPSI